jgi:uncharacterized protein (UPF0332 family)
MIAPELWYEKANMAAAAARQAFDAGNLPASANRAYFSLYAFLTGRLIDMGQQPPTMGNWPHAQIGPLVRQHFKTSFYKRLALVLASELRRLRLFADYADHRRIPTEEMAELLRGLGQVLSSQER